MNIPFNKPYFSGNELNYIKLAIDSGKISGDGIYTKKCHEFFKEKYGFSNCFLTTSCTDALEMAAILLNIQPGDEIIMPSFTFVSTANAFVLRGAKIIFCDSRSDHPGIDENLIESLITVRTKAIVVVHYAGVAVDMDIIMNISEKYALPVIEDAAQAIDSYYKGKPLGSIGHLAAFSFHETKNIQCGEGGLLVVNDRNYVKRAEIIREKGTDRAAFFRGEINKYGWVDIGSSFLPSDINAAFLFAQLENIQQIQKRRIELFSFYQNLLAPLVGDNTFYLPKIPFYASSNGHMFYLICKNLNFRKKLTSVMRNNNVLTVFHYQSLHSSTYYRDKHDGRQLYNSDRYSDSILRLPLYVDMTSSNVQFIVDRIKSFVS